MAETRTCRGCYEDFLIESFYRHVAYTKSCKEAYGDEWPKMQKEKKKLANKRSYEKNKEKIKLKYQENKDKEKREQVNKQRREKYEKEKSEKYERERKRINERPENNVRQHIRILRARAKKLNKYCYERFPEAWIEKIKQIKKDKNLQSAKRIIKKLKKDLKAIEDIFETIDSEIDNEIQTIFDSLEEKPSLIGYYYLSIRKLDQQFNYEVYPKWFELFKKMKKKLSKFMKINGQESIYYYWSDKTNNYEYWDEESEMLESFEKCLRKGTDPGYVSSDTDSSASEDSESTTDNENDASDDDDDETDDKDINDENTAETKEEIPPKLERGPKQCEGCNKTLKFESFLKHVTHKKSCFKKYGEKRISDLKKSYRTAAWKQFEKKGKDSKLKEIKEMPTHDKFQKELKELEESTSYEVLATISKLINALSGGIYYYKMVNKRIANPNQQISELVKQLESDSKDFEDLRQLLKQRFTELKDITHKLPGFDTFMNGEDGQKDIQKRHDDFITKATEEMSKLKSIAGDRFKTLENLLDLENSLWNERYNEFKFLAMGLGDQRRFTDSKEFKRCCEKASMLPENKLKRKATGTPPKQSDETNSEEDSPKITQKPYLHKRKKINFKLSELESAVEDENDSDYVE